MSVYCDLKTPALKTFKDCGIYTAREIMITCRQIIVKFRREMPSHLSAEELAEYYHKEGIFVKFKSVEGWRFVFAGGEAIITESS